jgi:hypothetical protein
MITGNYTGTGFETAKTLAPSKTVHVWFAFRLDELGKTGTKAKHMRIWHAKGQMHFIRAPENAGDLWEDVGERRRNPAGTLRMPRALSALKGETGGYCSSFRPG